MGRAYFEFDGKEIGNFCDVSAFVHRGSNANPLCSEGFFARWTKPIVEITPGAVHERGEFSQSDFCSSCFDWLQLPIEAALNSGNPLVLALAFVDRRCGKRRLRQMMEREFPPIAQRLFEIRLAAEGMIHETGAA